MKAVIDLGLISFVLSVLSFLGLIVYVIYNEVKKHIEDLNDQQRQNNVFFNNDSRFNDIGRRLVDIENSLIHSDEE